MALRCYTLGGMISMLFGPFGVQELVVILLIVLVLFGATRVPLLMRGLGQGVREFKDAVNTEPHGEGKEDQPSGKSSGDSEGGSKNGD